MTVLEQNWKAETEKGFISGASYKDVLDIIKSLAHASAGRVSAIISYLDSNGEWTEVEKLDFEHEGEDLTVINPRTA